MQSCFDMEYTDFLRKINVIIPDNWQFSEEQTMLLLKKRKEFVRSLKALLDPSILSNEKLSEIDKYFLFIREIAAIETLITDKFRKSWDEFSIHPALLLAKSNEQRNKVQYDLGSLHKIRNCIVHSLNLPKNNKGFKRIFSSNIDRCLEIAIVYHKLILLRFIIEDKGILPYRKTLRQLRDIRRTLELDIPESMYKDKITDEVDNLTGMVSPSKPFQLPPKEDNYFLGINTYGGLSTITHDVLDGLESFYKHDEHIIPERESWDEICIQIDLKKKSLLSKRYRNITLISKTHLSILFYLGYKFQDLDDFSLKTSFGGQQAEIHINESRIDLPKFWKIENNTICPDDREAIVIINVTHHLNSEIDDDKPQLNLENLPQVTFNFYDSNTGIPVGRKCIISVKQISEACRAIELFLGDKQRFNSLRKVHLFVRAPTFMVILLGMHFCRNKFKTVLYEYGKRSSDDENDHYYRVIECNE